MCQLIAKFRENVSAEPCIVLRISVLIHNLLQPPQAILSNNKVIARNSEFIASQHLQMEQSFISAWTYKICSQILPKVCLTDKGNSFASTEIPLDLKVRISTNLSPSYTAYNIHRKLGHGGLSNWFFISVQTVKCE